MEVIPLFPTAVGKSKISNKGLKELQELQKTMYDWKTNVGNVGTVDGYVLDNPKFSSIKAELEKELNRYLQEVYVPYKDKDPLYLYITQSWINITEPNKFHHKHMHPNSILSGVLYLDVDTRDSIKFHRYKEELPIDFDRDTYNSFNSSYWIISELKAGDLLVFPSTLEHDVPPREGEHPRDRISLAFNSYFRGEVGTVEGYTRLSL
jgi:uncharacterized protein (TIGR02466 family)